MLKLSPSQAKTLTEILVRFFNRLDIEIVVFGSRAKGLIRPDSDLDIALKSNKPLEPRLLSEARCALEESSLPFKVDLVDYQSISNDFRKIIDNSAVPLDELYRVLH